MRPKRIRSSSKLHPRRKWFGLSRTSRISATPCRFKRFSNRTPNAEGLKRVGLLAVLPPGEESQHRISMLHNLHLAPIIRDAQGVALGVADDKERIWSEHVWLPLA